MGEWTHFSATITIENTHELNILPIIQDIDFFKDLVETEMYTWDDLNEMVSGDDDVRTAHCWNQFIYESLVPAEGLSAEDRRSDMEKVIVSFGDYYDRFEIHPVPCPFSPSLPLTHPKTGTRFYKNISPDGQLITFTYEGDIEEWIPDEDIDAWVSCINKYFPVRSGVVASCRDDGGQTKLWMLGRVGIVFNK